MNPVLKKAVIFCNRIFGNIFFFAKRFKSPPDVANKILFISLYFNGDVLFGTPLIDVIRQIYPEAEIHFWGKSRIRGILEGYPFISKIHFLDDIRTRRFDENAKFNLSGKWKFFSQLRRERYDLIFDITGLTWTAIATWFAKPSYSSGFNFHGAGFLYNFESEAIGKSHLIDTQLNLILKNRKFSERIKKLKEIDRSPKYYISEASVEKVNYLLKSLVQDNSALMVCLHTTAGWDAKKLPIGVFVELAQELSKRFVVIILGGAEDKSNAALIQEKCKSVIDLTGELSINESAEVMRRCKLFIGADSGPLYIAEAVGTRTLSLFGPTNPLFSAPRGEKHKFIYHELFCSAERDRQNCKLNAGLNCRTVDCMKSIASGEILDTISQFEF